MQQIRARTKNDTHEAGHHKFLGGILRHHRLLVSCLFTLHPHSAISTRQWRLNVSRHHSDCERSWQGHSHGEAILAPSQEVFRSPLMETTPRITVIYPCVASPVPSLLGVSIGFHGSSNGIQSHSLMIVDGDSIMSYRDVRRATSKLSFLFIT